MKYIAILFSAGALTFANSVSTAENAPFADPRPRTFHGEVTQILTPTQVEVAIPRRGHTELLLLTLADISPGNGADGPCSRAAAKRLDLVRPAGRAARSLDDACKILQDAVENESVGVEISQWQHPITGYLSLGASIVNFNLIASGDYRVDYTQSRSAHLVLLEKEARCKRVGSWKSVMGNSIEEMKCQD